MKKKLASLVASVVLLLAMPASATINSPSAVEVRYSYETDFVTSARGSVKDAMSAHAKFLYGYLQNHSLVKKFALPEGNDGVGGPLWPPTKMTVLSDKTRGSVRLIRYRAKGRLLLHKTAAQQIVKNKIWNITLPYDVDHFFEKACGDWDSNTVEDFWYSYDPLKPGCEHLARLPLGQVVSVQIKAVAVEPALDSRLGEIRGNGDKIFLVASIDGFDSDLMTAEDPGRVSFNTINKWLVSQGFVEKSISEKTDSSIHQFDKTAARADGRHIHIRVLRFLGESEIRENNSVAFAQFLIAAIRTADVIVYNGHSGYGLNLKIDRLQARAGQPVIFNNSKRQIFFFDACSSYSYFLPVFAARKAKGTLDFLSNGIESMAEYGVAVDQEFFRILFDVNSDNPKWNDILAKMETQLDGLTFLLNVYRAPERRLKN